ncbi:HPF/RaiA family ribosome-associated protein [Mongoliitalea daihaiensis]|uniref:HPF/RaiA family ribosome-associated protein n=1 Tax=Mongoliitalea daihaiensis TaxID=2782006 RepID=UPI001F1CC0A0|nr:HPF/RaiA family ribosome-associated protein [Mongoliitalea daihaiensis]UJP64795.1 HPF/RaiA family ribosome-associated protein [Mongoliitalea daihaiensis]
MTIQFNTDKSVPNNDEFTAIFLRMIEEGLNRYDHHITRLEVHLSDEDGLKEGVSTKRCLLEARLKGRQPFSVINQSDTYDQAISGALDKLTTSLDTILGRLGNHQRKRIDKTGI